MTMENIMKLSGDAFLREVLAANHETRYEVWVQLRERLDSAQKAECFAEHLQPLLMPMILSYKNRLPQQEQEDFVQDALLDCYRRVCDYDPEHEGGKYPGHIFYSYVILGTFKKYTAMLRREYALNAALKTKVALDGVFCEESAGSAEETVLSNLRMQKAQQMYEQMQKKYAKSPYYARKKAIQEFRREEDDA